MLAFMQSCFKILHVFLTVLPFAVWSSGNELSQCGQRPGFSESPYRIVGGRNAKPGEIPWQVYLANERPPILFWPDQRSCAGSIIHKNWILTAAHCAVTRLPLVVVTGTLTDDNENFTGNFNDYPNLQIILVERRIVHPNFVASLYKNDIALLKLRTPIRFDNFSQPICLPQPGENFVMKVCKASGWGYLDAELEETTDWLKVVSLPVIPQSFCNRSNQALDAEIYIFDTNLCTLYPKGGKDTCVGDSGGPLACRRNNGQFVQAGVTSWGQICGSKRSPGVYTKISEYLDWIREKTGLG